MIKGIDEEEDELPELSDLDAAAEELGLDDGDLSSDEIEEAPEDVGLDVETMGGIEDGDESFLEEDGEPSALDDATLDFEGDLDDEEDEDGWTVESEGTGAAFDEELADDDEDSSADDGGLEGVEDPSIDDIEEEGQSSFPIEGEDLNSDEELERVELDLG